MQEDTSTVVEVEDDATSDSRHIVDAVVSTVAKRVAASVKKRVEVEVPGLSIPNIIKNLRIIGRHVHGLTELQSGPATFFSWKEPAFTVSGMVLFTVLCYKPYLVSCIPVFLVLTRVFIPNYARRFPIDPDLLPKRYRLAGPEGTAEEVPEPIQPAHEEPTERDVLLALRRGQASLARLVEGLDKLDEFRTGPANFVDIGESCTLYLLLLVVLLNTAFLTSLIPLSAVFAVTGWAVVLLAHPHVKRTTAELGGIDFEPTAVRDLIKRLKTQFSTESVIWEKEVEIFELQRPKLTPRLWETCIYTPYVYSETSTWRIAGKMPPGTRQLVDVIPPVDWCFGEEEWAVDKDAERWVTERGLQEVNAEGEWATDVSGDYRRRRWTRVCTHTASA